MKCLKINDGKGQFSINGSDFFEIDTIGKDQVLELVDLALSEDDNFEMDEYDEELFTNPAHRVIYKNLYEKFISLDANKSHFTSEVSELYQDTLDKYRRSEDSDSETQDTAD
jgi:hypothetical protein